MQAACLLYCKLATSFKLCVPSSQHMDWLTPHSVNQAVLLLTTVVSMQIAHRSTNNPFCELNTRYANSKSIDFTDLLLDLSDTISKYLQYCSHESSPRNGRLLAFAVYFSTQAGGLSVLLEYLNASFILLELRCSFRKGIGTYHHINCTDMQLLL